MEQGVKRKADSDDRPADKRAKTKKAWRVPKKNDTTHTPSRSIQPGDSGIWATCSKGREGKCIGELRDLFNDYAELLYGQDSTNQDSTDIEKEIMNEVSDIRRPPSNQLFTSVRLDVQCVVFFKTIPPIEPVSFVKKICQDALDNPARKRTRFVQRLSPMTLMGRASEEGLAKVGNEVLAPYFHQDPFQPRKFAIRPTLRNHNVLTRDAVIKQVASLVSTGHKVDLKNYDLLVVVEIYQNICGMSVVDNEFERLKRFNLAEMFEPTPKTATGAPPPVDEDIGQDE